MHRLQTLSAPLMTVLERLDQADRRAACIAACQGAYREIAPKSAAFAASVAALESGREVSATARADLEKEANAADERYMDLQEEAEEEPSRAPQALEQFSKARLGFALIGAFDATTVEQAADTIYEALSARSNPSAAARALLLTFS